MDDADAVAYLVEIGEDMRAEEIVLPCFLAPISISLSLMRADGSRPLIGSSSTSSEVSTINAPSNPSFCPMPLE